MDSEYATEALRIADLANCKKCGKVTTGWPICDDCMISKGIPFDVMMSYLDTEFNRQIPKDIPRPKTGRWYRVLRFYHTPKRKGKK